jgi:opacity protein-like surface antigen
MPMKRILWLVPAILLVCATARAQETQTPDWELAGGFSYARMNLSGTSSSFGMNGGTGSISENLNNWFGGRFELNAWGTTLSNTKVTAQTFTYGPVLSYRKMRSATLFAEGRFGAIHASEGLFGISESASKFAMALGGGLDYKVGKHAAIRFQGDYLLTRFLNARQDNIQVSSSLVIYLGKK